MKALIVIFKNIRNMQWWVQDGNNWCKTTWRYVLTGEHVLEKLHYDYGKDKLH